MSALHANLKSMPNTDLLLDKSMSAQVSLFQFRLQMTKNLKSWSKALVTLFLHGMGANAAGNVAIKVIHKTLWL